MTRTTLLLLLLCTVTALHAQGPRWLITAPNIIHVGVEETVSIQLHGATGPVEGTIWFEFRSRPLCPEVAITLNAQNSYQALVKIKLSAVDPQLLQSASEHHHGKITYISLAAIFPNIFSGKKAVFVQISHRRGYIFIQTNKPIYTPGETVKYRVFTLDQYMLPVDEQINLRVFNSKGLVVYSTFLKSSEIIQKTVNIPDTEPAGHWKIEADFSSAPESISAVEFEVKEYVLPQYEVKIVGSKPYYTLNDESFQVLITARYTYGKSVDGVAYIRFGIIDKQGNKIYLPGLENQISIKDGSASVKLLTSDFRNKAEEKNVTDLKDCHLYIAVTALEKASGNFEEAETSSVKIVTSPYVIDMSKTKKYFAPGSIFSIRAKTTYPDGTLIPDLRLDAVITVTLTDQTKSIITKEAVGTKGDVVIPFEVPKLSSFIHIRLSAKIEETATAQMTVYATQHTDSYLSIEVEHRILGPDQEITARLRDIVPTGSPRPSHIYYMVLSKGKILQARSAQTTNMALTDVILAFSTDMVPSFRLLAYYFRGTGAVVADSVWVDVKDVCKGKIEISPLKQHKPSDFVNVEVKADSRSKVAMVAVDSAVYILNKQNKLSTEKMFDYMNSYDLTCSVGGGKNHPSVFWDVGLIWICNCDMPDRDVVRKEGYSCTAEETRPKRAVIDFTNVVMTLGKEAPECCSDGVRYNRMGLTCEQRLSRVKKPGKCKKVFLECCKRATEMRKATRKYSLARTDSAKVDQAIDGLDVHLRSYFPESWLWQVLETDNNGLLRHSIPAPDSITKWEIQAVGISPTTGFCVAEPQHLTVFQSFFVSVKLPYSVKKNEQLEVKAVVFNYVNEDLEVTVEMLPTEGLCAAGGNKAKQSIRLPGNSASSVYFTVVPLETGTYPITILAHSSTNHAADKIEKELRVEEAGELISINNQYIISRQAPTVDFNISTPSDIIPGGEPDTYISFRGGVMGESVDNCLNLEGIERLIALPTGCAEQTMLKMSPAVHAMEYLDATDQWVYLNPARREEGMSMIKSGYTRILSYMKEDGSYGSFSSSPSSIWITAFVAKELTKARKIIPIQDSYIKKSIAYIVSKQLPGGDFQGISSARSIQGGVGTSSGNAALTAYVLMAMKETLNSEMFESWESSPVVMAVQNARSYLEQQLDSLQDPYSVAITAYALSLAEPQGSTATRAQKKLKELAICDTSNNMCFWGPTNDTQTRASPLSLETAAYALLHTVSEGDMRYAKRIASWITLQRKFGGGFHSTQDTVVALEALAKYSLKINDVADLDLTVDMCFQDGRKDVVKLQKRNALTQSAIKVMKGGRVSVHVHGKGDGTLSVEQSYRSLKNPDSACDEFSLNVTVEGEVEYQIAEYDNLDDYDNYDDGEPQKDEPMSRMDWFDLRTRRKRQASTQEKKEGFLIYTVCFGMKQGVSGGMVIIDISLLSGLKANIQDLEENEKSTEKYIDHYDLGSNRVYLYFEEVTDTTECLQFRAEQMVPIGLVQPAAAVIYDYYNPVRRCGIFYSAPHKSNMVSKLCDGDVCACAEGACPTPKVTFSANMQASTRSDFACYKPIVDYVYVVKVVSSTDDGVFKYYSTEVTKVLQIGKDEEIRSGETRELVKRQSCMDFELDMDAEYLFMGTNAAITPTLDAKGSPRYLLLRDSWLEKMPVEGQCKATRNRLACKLLEDFMEQHVKNRCDL
ncbi:hypothetical protein ACEWY4_008729 [Coilia grayii]|uniref:C4a anaphylatoxin n=1 Tax=Coilia grayii TaxID=363190 RepID=A0ABD1KBM9_9TELE